MRCSKKTTTYTTILLITSLIFFLEIHRMFTMKYDWLFILSIFICFCLFIGFILRLITFINVDNQINYANGLFLMMIICILTFPIVNINHQNISEQEKRTLATKPVLIKENAFNDKFTTQFELWWNDRFGGREKILKWHLAVNSFLMGYKENDKVFEGKEKWLFYKGDNSIKLYQNLGNFSNNEKQQIFDNLERPTIKSQHKN